MASQSARNSVAQDAPQGHEATEAISSNEELATRWELRQLRDRLAELAHVPGVKLSPGAFVLLLWHYGQPPGRVAMYRKTIAKKTGACECEDRCGCAQTIKRKHNDLRNADLLNWERIPAHHPLPWRNDDGYAVHLRNQICIVTVTKAQALALAKRLGLELGLRVVASAAGEGAPRVAKKNLSTGTKKTPSTRSRSSLFQREDLNNHHLGNAPARGFDAGESAEGELANSPAAAGESFAAPPAPIPVTSEGSATNVPPAMARVLTLWKKTGLAEPGRNRAPKVLANRHAELVRWEKLDDAGAWRELELCVIGASQNMKFLASKHCLVPFAVVFANAESVAQHAHQGRKIADARAAADAEERRAFEDDRKYRADMARRRAAEAAADAAELGPLPDAAPAPRAPMTPDEVRAERERQLAALLASDLVNDDREVGQ